MPPVEMGRTTLIEYACRMNPELDPESLLQLPEDKILDLIPTVGTVDIFEDNELTQPMRSQNGFNLPHRRSSQSNHRL